MHERKKIRQQLRQQTFKRDGQDTLLVATDVFGKSVTLCINGLVDTGESMTQDSNGFLTVGPSSKAEEIQRKGRGGRVTHTLYRKLYRGGMPIASEPLYVMEKRVAMSLVAAKVRLGRSFPIIGVPPSLEERCVEELIDLAVITSNSASSSVSQHQLTAFGRDVLRCSVDVHLRILKTVCSQLDLR